MQERVDQIFEITLPWIERPGDKEALQIYNHIRPAHERDGARSLKRRKSYR